MKVRSVAVIVVLCSVFLLPLPAAASGILTLQPSEGTTGSLVVIPSPCTYGLGSYYIYWGDPPQVISQGQIDEKCDAITFEVPEVIRGKHKVSLKIGDDTFDKEFNVQPFVIMGIDQGPVGTSVALKATGFNSNESGIKVLYDGKPVESGVRATGKGSWQATIKIPVSAGGTHTIDTDGLTPADEVPDLTFTVTPEIDINPASGWVGTVITVRGTGFDSAETNIKVTYDDLPTKTGISADLNGSWQTSFSVPTSITGIHGIAAYGAVTPGADVTEILFRVSPGMKLEMTTGYLGGTIHVSDKLWVTGVGFQANEVGISLTFDGNMVASGISADAKGSWSTQLEIPPCTRGEHIVDASGEATTASDIGDAVVVVSPAMQVTPMSGAVGDEVIINGTAFSDSQVVTISFDGDQVASGSATDSKGSFTASFRVPKCVSGDHTITVTDSATSVASVIFTVESTPPPIPQLISPESGASIGLWGDIRVPFNWSTVDDPSGVAYTLEVSQSADFSTVAVRKDGLEQSEYTLNEEEALGRGKYFWRVKAVDGAGNESNWTSGQFLEVGMLNIWMLVVAAVAIIAVIAVIWRSIVMSRRRAWK